MAPVTVFAAPAAGSAPRSCPLRPGPCPRSAALVPAVGHAVPLAAGSPGAARRAGVHWGALLGYPAPVV